MGHTNTTAKYKLPLFVGSDKPSWMGDFNGAMTAIDKSIQTVDGISMQAGTDASAAKVIADSALDIATAAQDASDVNAQEIAAIKAGGIKPATVAPESVGPQMKEAKIIAQRVGEMLHMTVKALLQTPSDPFSPSFPDTIVIARLPAAPGINFTNSAVRGICGNCLLYVTGGTQSTVVLPIQYSLGSSGDAFRYEISILDDDKRLKAILRDASKVNVYATVDIAEIFTAPEVV